MKSTPKMFRLPGKRTWHITSGKTVSIYLAQCGQVAEIIPDVDTIYRSPKASLHPVNVCQKCARKVGKARLSELIWGRKP
jgi:hypothetical protein